MEQTNTINGKYYMQRLVLKGMTGSCQTTINYNISHKLTPLYPKFPITLFCCMYTCVDHDTQSAMLNLTSAYDSRYCK